MKDILNIYLILLLLMMFTACSRIVPTPATVESMEDFIAHFEQELQGIGAFTQSGRGGGHSGPATSYRITFRAPPGADVSGIFDVGITALESWERHASYRSRGRGGGGNLFSMSYGDGRSRGFFDAVGYDSEHGAVVTVFWKVIE